MINLTASEPSLLDSKLTSSSWAARFWARLMNITATALSFSQQTTRRCLDRAVDHKLYDQMRYEVMRHEARRLRSGSGHDLWQDEETKRLSDLERWALGVASGKQVG